MKIWISSLSKVHDVAAAAKARRAVSLLSPEDAFPSIDGVDDHHRVSLHDIREHVDGAVTPAEAHVSALIDFLKEWRPDEPLLVHCWAGISRSTATAMIAACLHNDAADEMDVASAIAEASPTAYPNTLIAAHADKILDRGGRFAAAANAICADAERKTRAYAAPEAVPFSIPSRF
ncbi:MAG: tyrosine phosphatase family protein [Parvularculaceae bacterium]